MCVCVCVRVCVLSGDDRRTRRRGECIKERRVMQHRRTNSEKNILAQRSFSVLLTIPFFFACLRDCVSETTVVEIKNRVGASALKRPPPFYDEIQCVAYVIAAYH